MSDPTNDKLPSPLDGERPQDQAPPAASLRERPDVGRARQIATQLFSDYGMLVVLLLLIIFFSFATFEKRKPIGAEAAKVVAQKIAGDFGQGAHTLIVVRASDEDTAFAAELESLLKS